MRVRCIGESWKELRSGQQRKWKNYYYIEKFETALKSAKLDYDIDVEYYTPRSFGIPSKLIEYTETTPFVKQIKLSPNGYFINCYDSFPLWKNQDIDSSILQKIGQTNKYDQSKIKYSFGKPYILFALQSMNFSHVKPFRQIFP